MRAVVAEHQLATQAPPLAPLMLPLSAGDPLSTLT